MPAVELGEVLLSALGLGDVEPDVLALAPTAQKIAVGKRCGAHSMSQRFINKRLVDAATRFDIVVRLKGGDPMLFGRAQEEIDALAGAGADVEVVPGVTAAFAAAADLGLSLTRRGCARSVVFVTPRVGDGESTHAWARAAATARQRWPREPLQPGPSHPAAEALWKRLRPGAPRDVKYAFG